MAGLQETFYLGSEASRDKALALIKRAPLYDEQDRQLVVIVKRAITDYGRSKKRRFHSYVNMLAEHRGVPAPAMKAALKARLCPLVDSTNPITGEVTWIPLGIRQMSDEEAAALCEQVVQFAREEWEVDLPVTEEEFALVKRGGLGAITQHYEREKERA